MLHQASCVEIGGRAILIEGPSGSGKSSLALALIDRGASLVGDDGVTLVADGNNLIANPPPNTGGLLEIRNVGLVTLPTTTAPIALVILLDADAPRFVDRPLQLERASVTLPGITLWPDTPNLALRAEWALRTHGRKFATIV